MKYMKTRIAAIAATVVLAACGGGGDDSTSTSPSAAVTAEGFWNGSTTTGVGVSLAILENGETWGIYASGGSIVGALYGNTTSAGTTLSGSGSDFNIPSRNTASATYSGTFSPKSSISVNTSGGVAFTGTYDAAYDQPASLAVVAGSFSGQGVSGSSPVQGVSVTISSTGVITVPSNLGCSASGSIAPRPNGKNVFNVSVTFSGSNCALGNGATTTGVGYYNATTKSLLVLALNSARTDGFIYIGSK